MSDFEVPEAITCSPFEEPTHYWRLEEGVEPEKRPGRRPAIYYYPDPISQDSAGTTVSKGTAIELKLATHLIIETKGFDDLAEVKSAAARRWVSAVNADGGMGTWHYTIARKMDDVRRALDAFAVSH